MAGCAAGGVLLATASMGTTRDALEAQAAPARVTPTTTFFFGDEVDLLTEHARREAPAHRPGDPQRDVHVLPGSRRPAEYRPPSSPSAEPAPTVMVEGSAAEEDTPRFTADPGAGAATNAHERLADAAQALTAGVAQDGDDPDGAEQSLQVQTVVVGAGDSLSAILNQHGIGVAQMRPLLADPLVKTHLSSLMVGQEFEIARHAENGAFERFVAKIGRDRRLTIRRSADGFAVAAIDLPVERERVVSSGTIETSLFAAAAQAELKQATIMTLADIFQWELDFGRDIRRGDQFAIVYDRLYREGKYIGDGDILAAEFVRGDSVHRAIRFTDADGRSDYYSPDGQSKRRTFTRHPVDVVRITSHFDPERMHPVLHQIRAHRGTDYGAPYGSEIRATADGTIVHAGPRSSYGNTVILQHGQRVTTLYAHMSELASSATVGARVRQGDVIGYVGNTGRVTGTHLHYEFRVDGVHVDPLKVELPAADPLPAELHAELALQSDRLVAQIRSVLPSDDGAAVAMVDRE